MENWNFFPSHSTSTVKGRWRFDFMNRLKLQTKSIQVKNQQTIKTSVRWSIEREIKFNCWITVEQITLKIFRYFQIFSDFLCTFFVVVVVHFRVEELKANCVAIQLKFTFSLFRLASQTSPHIRIFQTHNSKLAKSTIQKFSVKMKKKNFRFVVIFSRSLSWQKFN